MHQVAYGTQGMEAGFIQTRAFLPSLCSAHKLHQLSSVLWLDFGHFGPLHLGANQLLRSDTTLGLRQAASLALSPNHWPGEGAGGASGPAARHPGGGLRPGHPGAGAAAPWAQGTPVMAPLWNTALQPQVLFVNSRGLFLYFSFSKGIRSGSTPAQTCNGGGRCLCEKTWCVSVCRFCLTVVVFVVAVVVAVAVAVVAVVAVVTTIAIVAIITIISWLVD